MRNLALSRQRPVMQRAFGPKPPTTAMLTRAIVNTAARVVGDTLKRKLTTPSTSSGGIRGPPAKRYRTTYTTNYRVRTLGHGKEKIRSGKRKIINRELKGKAKKFQRKVMRAVNHTKNFGEYTYFGQKQLRQGVLDKWSFFTDDFNGRPITIGNNRALVDAASICFNAKPMGNDYTNIVANFGPDQNLECLHERVEFYFKSTSSHVVNIEMYEFIAKVDTADSPLVKINESNDDYKNRYAAFNTATETNFTFLDPGSEIKYFPTLYQEYNVKVHKMKLPPGHTASKVFKRKARTYEAIKHLDSAENALVYNKGSSTFYFRVINDITCSTAAAAPAIVHHWNSNVQGGVAMQYKRVIRSIAPNQATTNDKPTIAIGWWCPATGSEADQQVCVQNPIATTTIG